MADSGAPRDLVAAGEDDGARLDAFLTKHCPELSRSRIQDELRAGRALVNGRPAAKNLRLRTGDTVVFAPEPRPAPTAVAQDIDLVVVHEDEQLVVVDKPAGLVVHPAAGHPDGTLVNALLHRYGHLAAAGDPLRPGLVHRLDRDTSGLLVVARDDRTLGQLQAQLQERRMGRIYRAFSWGRWPGDEGVLAGDIGRHPRRRQRMAVVPRGGRTATTRYRVEEDFVFVQSCRVELETGRTHQIRVHFAHHGHPVVGDPLYGDDARARGVHHLDRRRADAMVRRARRQMLHAEELHFAHPATGTALSFRSELPADMAAVLAGLRAEA